MPDYRREFPDFAPTVYLDCAYQGPFPKATVARIQHAIELKCRPARLEPPDYFELPERVRKHLAGLVGGDPSEIALTNSATQGIGIVAAGLGLSAEDEVVIASTNFPSNLFTWLHLRRLGVRVIVLRPSDGLVRIEDVMAALSSRTRVLALDWVNFNSGLRIDLDSLGDLAHRRGAIFVVDGSQGVGALELNLHALPVDVFAAAGYKWLLGPYGAGFVFLSSEVQDRLDLQVVNWLSVEGSEEFDELPVEEVTLPKAARIFDVPETANFLNLHAVDASLEFVERAGVRIVTEHCCRLLERLADGLRRMGHTVIYPDEPPRRSTILTFQAGSPEATVNLHNKLRSKDVAVSLRHGLIRVSPYLYNDEADIDRMLSVVRCP
jgi:selenocysteine lyase/cysteine desulfurase